MLTKYVHAAMGKARYETLPDDGMYYGEIPGFDGVYANAASLEACRTSSKRCWRNGSFSVLRSISPFRRQASAHDPARAGSARSRSPVKRP